MIKIFTQTEEELVEKIKYYIDDDEIEIYYKEKLKEWHRWFSTYISNISLVNLSDNMFYRAYYQEPDIYGIQVWIEEDDVYVWYSNLYMNKNVEENNEETIVLE